MIIIHRSTNVLGSNKDGFYLAKNREYGLTYGFQNK